jgi:hypothetical protein
VFNKSVLTCNNRNSVQANAHILLCFAFEIFCTHSFAKSIASAGHAASTIVAVARGLYGVFFCRVSDWCHESLRMNALRIEPRNSFVSTPNERNETNERNERNDSSTTSRRISSHIVASLHRPTRRRYRRRRSALATSRSQRTAN